MTTWISAEQEFSGPDIYFNSAYGRVCEISEQGSWHCLVLRGGLAVIPMLVRELPTGARDAVSPYGYSGIYLSESIHNFNLNELWSEIVHALNDREIISLFVRESPILPQLPRPSGASVVVEGHPTFLIDISDEDSAWAAMEGRSRTAIRKALKSGATTEISVAQISDVDSVSDFRGLYESTMGRVSAKDYYFFDDEYYAALVECLGDSLLIAKVALDGETEAAALFFVGPDTLHYHLSGASVVGSRSGCTNLLLWEAMKLGSDRGLKKLHLGGGVQAGDGLERFKRSLGGDEMRYGAYGVIAEPVRYAEEVKRREVELGLAQGSLSEGKFFPAYRSDG